MPRINEVRQQEEDRREEDRRKEEARKKAELEAASAIAAQRGASPEAELNVKLTTPTHKAADNTDRVLEAYNKQYPPKEGEEPKAIGDLLVFPSIDALYNFFTALAQSNPPCQFLAINVATQEHLFSCGDGTLYKGSKEEVRQQLEKAAAEANAKPETKDALALFDSYFPAREHAASRARGVIQGMQNAAGEREQPAPAPAPRRP